ncbi:glycosyltransferase [Acetobacter peroxydans]|jgi:dolichol-phosphate mannosyltransferase|uniref:glycosyltransferase n=1 Tax=Acetobacter peroxydans TaxID=104098 RepID=UPI0023540D3E|nr:glycosyltransferase family 2 protein [Acetobacter peroxydans]MCH4142528.1 glycosyltransferase family 2 protein [Acetobacter peroxydans]MCI1395380.1 glycosyltransferase family 2 protein [Acetobacter peroxydans]MCI1410739.1 glycosyltransferase family 2 protein [Acetobacter peroxydans]MCI1439923.1 glycosyltransferase family 2 protein [Acetobacter peroxydans]MCI1566011.1 glycosyltransferase family 2 protein [Acetobacter peroxydans]
MNVHVSEGKAVSQGVGEYEKLGAGTANGQGGPDVSIIVPCYNESANVRPLVEMLRKVLDGRRWEVIFVDDNSPDGTSDVVRALAQEDSRVRGLCRIGRRGLSSAVIEGALSSSAQVVAVMDGDLQHDESRLPALIDAVAGGGCDLAVGSRHVEGGSNQGLANAWRHALSDGGIWLAQRFMPVRLTDPMSGFFAIRQDRFRQIAPFLAATGFKILLDLVLSSPTPLKVQEIPCGFRARVAGESKLDVVVMLQFGALLVDKLCHGLVPLRFIAFCGVGFAGVLTNLVIMRLALLAGADFSLAQGVGTVVAMIVNFFLDNTVTYRDRRLKGARAARGLLLFVLVCSVGAVANIGIARLLYDQGHMITEASVAGAIMAAVWNYAMSSTIVWRP